MSIKKGTTAIVDRYKGTQLIEKVYKGSDLIFDAFSEITGSLPLSFNARVAGALKNYRIFGTAAGAGVQTENLYNRQNKDPNNGYVDDNYIKSNGDLASSSVFEVSEYVPIEGNATYYLYWRIDTSSAPGYVFYDENKVRVGGGTYGERSGANITTPSNARYLRFSVRKNTLNTPLIGLYMTEPDAPVPYGYKIPLTLTTEVTKEMFDKDAKDTEKGFVNSSIIDSGGVVRSSSQWCVSEYIPITIGVTYQLYWGYDASSTAAVAFYNTNKEVLGGHTYGSTVSYTFTPDADGYLRFSYRKALAEETSLSTSEQTSDTYPLYIGSTKLGEEENVDYQEQKVYKRTENLWNPEMEVLSRSIIKSSGSTGGGYAAYSVSDYIPMEAEKAYIVSPVTTIANASAYHAFYDSNKEVIDVIQIGSANQSKTFTTPANCAYMRFTFREETVPVNTIMLVQGNTLPETFIPYFQPTDPPTPLQAITAYQGENTISSTETVGNVTIKGRISEISPTP